MSDVIYLTRERLRELEDEIKLLKGEKRKEIAEKIAEARSYGDLSENAEYDAAKEAQGLLESRIRRLEQVMARARVIESGNLPNDKVYILSTVKVLNHTTGKTIDYLMVSAEEADIEQGKLAVSSPIGKALMGRTVGDVVEVKVPAGTMRLEVLEHSR
jgi:transcription elongation factor GreA